MKTDYALIPAISEITGLEPQTISKIFNAIDQVEPDTAQKAEHILNSDYSTSEEKARASVKLAEFTEKEIDEAQILKAAKVAYDNVDRNSAEMVEKAVKKMISLAKSIHDLLEIILRFGDRMAMETKNKCASLVRAELLKLATDMESALKMWNVFMGTDDENELLMKMRGFFHQIAKQVNSRQSLAQLYRGLSPVHPMSLEVFKTLVCTLEEADLRMIWKNEAERLAQAKEQLKSSTRDQKMAKAEIQHFEATTAYVVRKIDNTCYKRVSEMEKNEKLLLKEFEKTSNPELGQTICLISGELISIWTEKPEKDQTFGEALETLVYLKRVNTGCGFHCLDTAWGIVKNLARTKHEFKYIIKLAGFGQERECVIKSWLEFGPPFDELVEVFEQTHSKVIIPEIIKTADTFSKATRMVKSYFSDPELRQKAVEKLADMITSLGEGTSALELMNYEDSYKGRRAIILRKTLTFVKNRHELRIAKKYLGDTIREQEERLLVEKAQEVVSEEIQLAIQAAGL